MLRIGQKSKGIILVALLSATVFIGADRLPLFPNGDEVQVQDVALSLSEGDGLRAPSYEGIWISDLYAHYPPLYLYIQSFVIGIFGVSAYSVRLISLLSFVLLGVLFFLCSYELCELGIASRWLAIIASLIVCTEITSFHLARWGRVDMLGNALGMAGLLSVLKYEDKNNFFYVLLSAFIIGLSISTHFQCVVFYLFFSFFLIFFVHNKEGVFRSLYALSIPPLVLLAFWLFAHQGRIVESIEQLRLISEYQGFRGINLKENIQHVVGLEPSGFISSGGPALFIVLASWLLSGFAFLVNLYSTENIYRSKVGRYSTFALILSLSYFLVAQFIIGINVKRSVSLLFPSIVIFIFSMKSISLHKYKVVKYIMIFILSIQVVGLSGYVGQAILQWEDRSPRERAWPLGHINDSSKVAGIPKYWYPFKSEGREYRVIQFGFRMDKKYWEDNPEKIKKFDFLILNESHPLAEKIRKVRGVAGKWRKVTSHKSIWGNVSILKKLKDS